MTTPAVSRLNLRTRHGREIARAVTANPNYVPQPPPPPLPSPTLTAFQASRQEYVEKVHVLRKGYQKQEFLRKLEEEAKLARKVQQILAHKAKRKELVNYEKSVLKAKAQEAAIHLAEVKAIEREQHAANRIKYEETLRQRRIASLQYLIKERQAHWVENHKLTPHLFDSRYDGLTGFWVKAYKKQEAQRGGYGSHSLLMQSTTGRDLDTDEEDELKLLDYRGINDPKTSYHPADIVAPQFKRSAAERTALKEEKKIARQRKKQGFVTEEIPQLYEEP